jgi:manganese/iron transport system substrate-binding protein
MRAIDADFIRWNGLNSEIWFEQFVANLGHKPSVTLTDGIDPVSIASESLRGS